MINNCEIKIIGLEGIEEAVKQSKALISEHKNEFNIILKVHHSLKEELSEKEEKRITDLILDLYMVGLADDKEIRHRINKPEFGQLGWTVKISA